MEWRVGEWDEPDLREAAGLVRARSGSWGYCTPRLELVACRDGPKPAFFAKVGTYEYPAWSSSVVARRLAWWWVRTPQRRPYAVLQAAVWFEDTRGHPLGTGAIGPMPGTARRPAPGSHRLRCTAFLDPADARHREAVTAWAACSGPAPFFVTEETFGSVHCLRLPREAGDGPLAVDQLRAAERELRAVPADGRGTFQDACAFLRRAQPALSRWRGQP